MDKIRGRELRQLAQRIAAEYRVSELVFLIRLLRRYIRKRAIKLTITPEQLIKDYETAVRRRYVYVPRIEEFKSPEELIDYICRHLFELEPYDSKTRRYLKKWALYCAERL